MKNLSKQSNPTKQNYQQQKSMKQSVSLSKEDNQSLANSQILLTKQKNHQPPRFQEFYSQVNCSQKIILNDLEAKIHNLELSFSQIQPFKLSLLMEREAKQIQPKQKILQTSELLLHPISHIESDEQFYNEIFVKPKAQILNSLHQQEINIKKFLENNNNLLTKRKKKIQQYYEAQKPKKIQKIKKINSLHEQIQFFEQQIKIQPPDIVDLQQIHSNEIKDTNAYPSAIPLLLSTDSQEQNLSDLLTKASAGKQTGDIQKEAHVNFILALIHEEKKKLKKSIIYYKKFLICAEQMQDKIAIALAFNRLGICYFKSKSIQLSLLYHEQNLQLSDEKNQFACYYNIGITFRRLKKFNEANIFFDKALNSAQLQKNAYESQAMALAEQGITLMKETKFNEAFGKFERCQQMAQLSQNLKLKLNSLLLLINICQKNKQDLEYVLKVLDNCLECARQLNNQQAINLCLCTLGYLEGSKKLQNFKTKIQLECDI